MSFQSPALNPDRSNSSFPGWRNEQQYIEFTSRVEGRVLESELAKKSSSPLQADLLGQQMSTYQRALEGSAAELHTIDFPKGHRELLGDKLAKVEGMVYRQNNIGIDGSSPAAHEKLQKRAYQGVPARGWVVPATPDDSNVDQAIWFHLWRSSEQEKQFKDTEGRTKSGLLPGVRKEKDGSEERFWPTQEFFEEELKKLGALDVKSEHYEFRGFRLSDF